MAFFLAFIGLLIGGFSAFNLFALTFNGVSWEYLAGSAALIGVASGLVGRFAQNWKAVMSGFFLPHLVLFYLLLMGSFEKGIWAGNLFLIVLVTVSTFLPAYITSQWTRLPS